MTFQRQALFWLAAFGALIAFIWLLHGILLPFVAGAALAYLLDPLANRIERLGVNRFVATLLMMAVFVLVLVLLGDPDCSAPGAASSPCLSTICRRI